MITVEDFSRLVSGVYAAAVTPQQWETAIRDIHCTLGAPHAALLMADQSSRSILSSTVPSEAGASYMQYYHRLDYVLAEVETGPVGVVRGGRELTDPVKHPEFHSDWARPYEGDDGLIVRLTDGPRTMCFVVGTAKRTEWFDTPDRVKVLRGLVPHMQQALRTQSKLTDLAGWSADLARALEAVRHAIFIVRSECWVLHLNSAAERIARAQDGVYIHAGCLTAATPQSARNLHQALRAALTVDEATTAGGQTFTCERPSGKLPYIVHVLPLRPAGTHEVSHEETALVAVIDPEQEPQPASPLLRRIFGLTRMEAEVALRILRGADIKEISEELSLSMATVRTHLQHVFDKTDTHRQAELVRRLLLVLRP